MTGTPALPSEHGKQTLVLQMVSSVPLAGWETGRSMLS